MINVRSVPCWFEPAVINGPAKRLLLQIGGKKGAATTNMLFCLFISLSHSAYITFRIIMSFRKPCHMPFRKLIPSFTLTGLNRQSFYRNRKRQLVPIDRYRFRSIGKLIGSVSHDRVAYRYLDAFPYLKNLAKL